MNLRGDTIPLSRGIQDPPAPSLPRPVPSQGLVPWAGREACPAPQQMWCLHNETSKSNVNTAPPSVSYRWSHSFREQDVFMASHRATPERWYIAWYKSTLFSSSIQQKYFRTRTQLWAEPKKGARLLFNYWRDLYRSHSTGDEYNLLQLPKMFRVHRQWDARCIVCVGQLLCKYLISQNEDYKESLAPWRTWGC